ncbi:MAG: hypothetical protein V8T45_02335 [Oscillospiraceae bacterium]
MDSGKRNWGWMVPYLPRNKGDTLFSVNIEKLALRRGYINEKRIKNRFG